MTVIWTETAKFHWKQATDYIANRTFCHRSIVFAKHSKLVYSVFDDYVLINDYWDTRQESENLKKRL